MIDIDEAFSIIEEKIDKMSPEERVLFLKKMGFEFNNSPRRRGVRIGRVKIRRGRRGRVSPVVKSSKRPKTKRGYAYSKIDDKNRKTKATNT